MACLNTFDLIAYPGQREVARITASTGAAFRTEWAEILGNAGWEVERADVSSGPNPGIGFKCTSRASPWCSSGPAPAEYVGKCKVWFRPLAQSGADNIQKSEITVMNASETMEQTGQPVTIQSLTGAYAPYSYMLVATPYDFKLFMLGVASRASAGIAEINTAVVAGVPQIPSFLQGRGGWCQYGINEMFYIAQTDGMRAGSMGLIVRSGRIWAGGISSSHGTFMNSGTNNASSTWVNGLRFSFGTGDPNFAFTSQMWVLNAAEPDPEDWDGLMWPAMLGWPTDPANAGTTDRLKGFMWDAIVLNKALPIDAKLRFDNHEFIVFASFPGQFLPYIPPSSLLLTVAGSV